MAEIVLELARPAASNERPKQEARPAPAAAAPPASSTPPARGPHNNWGQPVAYRDVHEKPADFDGSRPPSDEAPLGYLRSGDPWSPYGTTEKGRIRRRPSPTLEGRDPVAKTAAGTLGQRRLAPSELKPPAAVVELYAAIDDTHRRLGELVRQVKQRHPESTYEIPPHPKALGAAGARLGDPQFEADAIADVLIGTTGGLSRLLGDPEARPSKDTIKDASKKIAEASRHYGINADPKTAATVAAVIAVVFCFAPAILCALGKLIDKIRGE